MREYDELFRAATGNAPYPWQRALALGDRLPVLARIPTGAGKTEGAALGWLWRRRFAAEGVRAATPRRLVYCLPMRVLVEQTVERVADQFRQAGVNDITVHQLMGGSTTREWTLRPEDDAVIVGTLDQLVSRALMRGYGVSRYAWPIHFALLHNDALWVYDEVQLMGEALATSAQLQGFRNGFPTPAGPVASLWMSATVEPGWLGTVDHPAPSASDVLRLSDADRRERLAPRLSARKTIRRAEKLDRVTVAAWHRPGTLTLAVMNTVAVARELAGALTRAKEIDAEVVLVHSRFRPADRAAALARLTADVDPAGPGRIVVATQVVEAGVDVDAATLLTEVAPWASLVQRFGRCNRAGLLAEATVVWAPPSSHRPYEKEEIEEAGVTLAELEGATVGPDALEELDAPLSRPPRRFVLRRPDFLGLFDTAPDISGLDLDVERYIRDGDDLTVHFAWRDLGSGVPAESAPQVGAAELCPASIGDAREAIKQRKERGAAGRPFRFDSLGQAWAAVDAGDLRPGDQLIVDRAFGAYSAAGGFDPRLTEAVLPVVPASAEPAEALDSDSASAERGQWLSIAEHTENVCAQLEVILSAISPLLEERECQTLRAAARFHDRGKAHAVFQAAMQPGFPGAAGTQLAKRVGVAPRYARRGFRHELASLLAYTADSNHDPLVAYLVAAHHGRVRLGARSLPTETPPAETSRAFVLGCWQGDELPATDIGGAVAPPVQLDLRLLEIGGSDGMTYTDMALEQLDGLGPYRLAFLEAVLRLADGRASALEEAEHA